MSDDLERCAAVGAHVVETAFGLAGIDDLGAAASRAANDVFELHKQRYSRDGTRSCKLSAFSSQRRRVL